MPTRKTASANGTRNDGGFELNDIAAPVTVVAASDLDVPEEDVNLTRWQGLAERALASEGVTSGELNLLFLDEAAMAELNVQHMGNQGPTDVLAFPIDGDGEADHGGVPVLLGDVIICPSVARRNAQLHGVGFDDEVALLVVHGLLHVLGHDHTEPEETAVMKSRESALLEAHHTTCLTHDGDPR